MSALPSYYEMATWNRRGGAALINLMAIGMLGVLADALDGRDPMSGVTADPSRDTWAVFVAIFWLLSALTKSPGALAMMLKFRSEDLGRLPLRAKLLRSLPYLLFATMHQLFEYLLPPQMRLWYPYCFLTGVMCAIADGVAIVITKRSVLDLLWKVKVLQLSLPNHLATTIFGRRFM